MLKESKRCPKCAEVKDADCFRTHAYTTNQGKRSIRLDSYCKACKDASRDKAKHNLGQNRRRALNPLKAALHGSLAKHKRRAEHRGLDRKEAVQAVRECLEGYRVGNLYWDVYSSCLIERPIIDHIEPLGNGGSHLADNLCVTDYKTNRDKSENVLIVWLAKRLSRAAL